MTFLLDIIPVFFGGILGYCWYKIIGCRSGVYPLTSNAFTSTLYGAFMGFIMGVKL